MILPWRWNNGRSAPAVRAQGINFAYGRGDARTQVLFDISIEIPPGQFAVMTGPSGSGKTTLLTVIGGLRSMQQGQLDVLGHDLSHLSSHDLVRIRREIDFIFQMHNLFEALTATENVRMALQLGWLSSREVRLRARELLEQFGLPTGSTISRIRFRAVSASASRSPAPLPTVPGWSWPTSRPRRSTRMQPPMSSVG